MLISFILFVDFTPITRHKDLLATPLDELREQSERTTREMMESRGLGRSATSIQSSKSINRKSSQRNRGFSPARNHSEARSTSRERPSIPGPNFSHSVPHKNKFSRCDSPLLKSASVSYLRDPRIKYSPRYSLQTKPVSVVVKSMATQSLHILMHHEREKARKNSVSSMVKGDDSRSNGAGRNFTSPELQNRYDREMKLHTLKLRAKRNGNAFRALRGRRSLWETKHRKQLGGLQKFSSY